MIGVVGDSNTGKSTLVNALLGQRLLPQSHKCCSAFFASVTLIKTEVPRMNIAHSAGNSDIPESVEGRREILKRLSEFNEERRKSLPLLERDWSANPLALEASLHAQACPELYKAGACDGTLTLLDMPGQDEADGPVSDGRLDDFLSLLHGVFVLVRHDRLHSKTLVALLDRLAANAPHLLSTPGAVTLVISHVDTLRVDEDSDHEDCNFSCNTTVLEGLKDELRSFLFGRSCLRDFPGFAQEVQIIANSVDARLQGGHEFPRLLEIVADLHDRARELQRLRRVRLCEAIYASFCDDLLDVRPRYPIRAGMVLEAQENKEVLDVALTTISAAATLVAIPLGGVAVSVGCATRITLAGLTLGLGLAAGASTALDLSQCIIDSCAVPQVPMLCDEARREGAPLGAIGVHEANRQINFNFEPHRVLDGAHYLDTLLSASGKPLYVGSFCKNLPHGPGRLFWPSTGYEAFIGEFDCGLPSRGVFLNELGFILGHMHVASNGRLEEVARGADHPRRMEASARVEWNP